MSLLLHRPNLVSCDLTNWKSHTPECLCLRQRLREVIHDLEKTVARKVRKHNSVTRHVCDSEKDRPVSTLYSHIYIYL